MIVRILLALLVAIVVGLLCMYLLGPIVLLIDAPPAAIVGGFLIRWGWTLGIIAGLWYLLTGQTWPRGQAQP